LNHPTRHETLAVALSSVAVVVVLAACGPADRGSSNEAPTKSPARLNAISAAEVVHAFTAAGLPASNPHNVTALKCPKLQCLQAVDTDTVSVIKFPAPGPAELYAGAISNAFQVEDVVVIFAPTVTADLKAKYRRIVERAAT
jgi:hypothetical protein